MRRLRLLPLTLGAVLLPASVLSAKESLDVARRMPLFAVQTNTDGFGYTSTRAYWTSNGPSTATAFYRVQIWQP
jgi:hypothetical protein